MKLKAHLGDLGIDVLENMLTEFS